MPGTVTGWLHGIREGDKLATEKLWNYFYLKLCRKVVPHVRSLAICDEEDVALAALGDLIIAVGKNQSHKDVEDRTNLWRLLCVIAIRKANDYRKFERARKRGGQVRVYPLDEQVEHLLASNDSAPDMHMHVIEHCNKLIGSLDNDRLRKVAELKIRGLKNCEVARELSCSRRTVQYMLKEIKGHWMALSDS